MDKDKLALNLTDSADVEITPEYADMDRLALSEPLEFIAKYNTPKEWILEQEEAEKIKAISAPANLVGGVGEKIQYGVGEALYNIGRSPSELAQLGTGIVSGAGKVLFPHSTDTALDRLYKNIALENAKNRDEREKIVTAFTGGDSDWVNWVSGLTELGLMVGGGVGAASIGASAARRGVEKLATTTAKGVAMSPSKVRRAASIAAAKGARSGQIASTIGLTFAQEGGSAATEKVRQYIAKTGDTGLTNYDPLEDSVMSLAVGAINSAIEVGFGVERFIPEFWGTSTNFNRAARRFLEGAAGEGLEEFAQNITTQLSDIISGYKNDIDWGEAWNNAIMGAVLGGAAGSGMYYINRRRMANRLANDYGMDYKKAAGLVDDMLGTGIEATTNELSARSELVNERGSAWERMITGVKTAMGTVDFGTEESRENQAKAFARTNASVAMRFAQQSGLSTDEFLDVAEFETMNNGQNLNMVFIKPLGSVQDIDNRIKAQDEIINRQKELKKTGAADNNVLNLARQRKAILQKAKAIKQYNDAQYQEQIKANTTPETAQEIETATKDVESVKGVTQAEFDSKVDTENLTSAEKSKRYGNAVLKSILPTKTDFDAVMVDPMYANAKQAIIAVADRINSFIKAHRTYSLKTDIANALQKMQTVNQGNFIDSVTTPDLDGVDVIAENAFLYHFLFSDATTIQTYLDSYITRAEDSLNQKKGKLSKKDLVGQAFKATDNAMQTQAQVIGAEYTSIYNEDGSYADKNVMAVMLSYQNQFVQEQGQQIPPQMLEQFDLADENARLDDIYPAYTGETIEVDGKERTVYNSNGDRIAKSKEALTNFWRWFGDSKVVDEQGRPLVVYHGTKAQFDEFNINSPRTGVDIFGRGFYFTPYKNKAKFYGKIVMPVYLSITNPENITELTPDTLNSDTAKLKEEGKNGIIFDRTNDKTDELLTYVAFEPTQIKSVDNRGTYSADTGNIYFQEEPTDKKELVVTHGITLDKLNKALELGGLPVPSIAISRINEPLENFGDIKLIGTKNIINPELSKSNLVYDRDVWTRRFPRPEYKNAKLSEVRKFRDKFKEYFIRTDDESVLYGSITDPMVNSKYPAQAIENFQDSKGAKLYYIENVLGDKVDVPKYDRAAKMFENLTLFVKPDTKFVEEVAQIDPNIDNIDKLRNKIEKPIRDLINRFDFEKEYPKYAEKMKQEAEDYYFGEKFKVSDILSLIRSAKEYLRLLENENSRYGVDRFELEKILDKYKLYDNNDYMKWSEKQITDLLGEPKVRVGNKLMPWTLENITAAMIKGKTVAVETTGVEVGKIIASGATKFSSLESIREKGKELKTKTESEAQTDQLGADMYQFASDIISVADLSDNFSNIDMVLLSLQEGVSKSNITEDGLENILNKNLDILAKYPRNILKRGVDLIKQTKKIVRYYFEAKPQRAVSLNEFIGAVIPEDSRYDEISNKLKERGFYVARTKNLQEGISIIENQTPVLFQSKKANGFYDPELGVIVLGRNMNEMTLPHEMQHYWLDKIFSIYKRAKSGELQVRDEWMTETKALFDMLGIDENQTQLTQGQQEKFARMSEAYLTGIGVTGDMNATFKEYQQWVPEKYKSILNLGYLSDDGKVEYPFLDQGAVDFFNKWYANYSLPSLATSPERQEFINPEDENGEVLPVSIKEMNNRDKEFGNDAEEQVKTDQRLYNTLDENMPAEIKVEADGQKVVQASRSNFLKESEKQQRRWFERKSRDTEAQLAQDYIEKNPEHAKEVIFGDPELIPNDTGIDRATLINAYMALNNITPESEDWATLHTNIAINQSLAGTQLALSNNTSYRTYLDALREIENAREMKAATNYAGAKQGAVERFNRDIQRFVDEELPKVLATAPNTETRDIALKSLFERARTKFSGNTTGGVLNQMDFDYARGQKGASAAFTRWAVNQIKKDAGAKLNGQEQAKLLNLSAKAQQAVIDLDDRDTGKAVAGAQEIRKWQVEKDKLMGVKPQKFSLFGDYAPRAMLASFNTLVVSNIPSTAMNTAVVRMLESGIFGKNEVSKSLTDSEIKRIKAIYGATAMNLAQMEKPTSPSLLHGEKYSSSGQKWYDPFTILGKEDNWFRVPTFVNTLARIATQDAKATGKSADEVFKEYCRLENQSDAAKLARKQALAVSNMAVFTQDGALARSLNGIRDWINQGSRALIGLDPKGFGLGNLLSPFLKTGANIAEMGIRGSLAPITTISALAQKWRSGKAIDPMKKLALAMDWTYFLLSSVMVSLLAALTSDDDEFYTEPYEMGKTYDPDKPYDSINIAGVWIDLDFFGPFAIPIRTGCRLVQQWKKDNLSAIYKGYGQGLKYAAMDTPLLESVFNNQMSYASKKPEDWATGYLYTQANKLVPSQVKPLSRAISRGTETQLDMGWSGKVIDRKFHRNYGWDGTELTTQDLIDIFTTKITWQPKE